MNEENEAYTLFIDYEKTELFHAFQAFNVNNRNTSSTVWDGVGYHWS